MKKVLQKDQLPTSVALSISISFFGSRCPGFQASFALCSSISLLMDTVICRVGGGFFFWLLGCRGNLCDWNYISKHALLPASDHHYTIFFLMCLIDKPFKQNYHQMKTIWHVHHHETKNVATCPTHKIWSPDKSIFLAKSSAQVKREVKDRLEICGCYL